MKYDNNERAWLRNFPFLSYHEAMVLQEVEDRNCLIGDVVRSIHQVLPNDMRNTIGFDDVVTILESLREKKMVAWTEDKTIFGEGRIHTITTLGSRVLMGYRRAYDWVEVFHKA